MKVINKKLGNDFEQELCEILYDAGYWVHLLNQNKNGQPADIIAVKNTTAYLMDAKVCTYEVFPFRRIEDNQQLAMDMWIECNNIEPYFALKVRNEVYMVGYPTIKGLMRKGKKQLNLEDINKYGTRIATWLRIRG